MRRSAISSSNGLPIPWQREESSLTAAIHCQDISDEEKENVSYDHNILTIFDQSSGNLYEYNLGTGPYYIWVSEDKSTEYLSTSRIWVHNGGEIYLSSAKELQVS